MRMVEPIVLGIVLGLVCISIAGLFVAAFGSWALASRLGVLLAISALYVPAVFCICQDRHHATAFPAFAQTLYANPIDATGKAACSNCHLADAPIRLSGPSAVFASSVFDLLIEVPTFLDSTQVSPADELVGLNVGGVVVLPEGFAKGTGADSKVFTSFSAAEPYSYVFGPLPASEYATTVFTVLTPVDGRSLSYPIVVAGNRGRGQLYPDGSPSNNGGFRSAGTGWTSRIHISREGTSLAGWTTQATTQLTRLPGGVDILGRQLGHLGTRVSADTVLATNPNVGGVGQSEVLLVLQSKARLGYYVQVVAATAATQLALVLKKKQYERFRLGQTQVGRGLLRLPMARELMQTRHRPRKYSGHK